MKATWKLLKRYFHSSRAILQFKLTVNEEEVVCLSKITSNFNNKLSRAVQVIEQSSRNLYDKSTGWLGHGMSR